MTYARYRHLAIERAKPAPTAEQVASIESLLGARLPQSFRDFLAVANGGTIDYVIDVPLGDGKTEPLSFCSVFSADEGTFCDETFVGEIRSGREHVNLPPGVLPFARDGGGSMVYLDLTKHGAGRVVAFVQGLPEWTGLRTESAFIHLAASFYEYVSKLRIDREGVFECLARDASEVGHVNAMEEWLDIGMPEWRSDAEFAEAVREARRRLTSG